MAPPFSPTTSESLRGDDDNDDATPSRRRRGGARNRTDAALEDNNALSNIDQILLDNESQKRKSRNNMDPDEEDQTDEEKRRKNQLDPYYEQPQNVNKFALEIPVVVQYPDKKQENQSSLLPKLNLSQNARCSMHCFVPPSTPKGRWTGSITGNTKVFQTVGSAHGSADISYKASPHVRLMGGAHMMTTKDSRPLQLHVGAQLKSLKNQSTMQVTLQQGPEHTWGIHVLTREIMDPWVFTSNIGWNTSSLNQTKKTKKGINDAGGRAMISLSSMTTHVVRLGFGWAFLPYSTSMMQLMINPKLSSNRRLPLSFQYQPTSQTWNATVTFQTAKPKKKEDAKKSKSTSASSSSVINSNNGSSSTPASWRVGIQGGGKPALQFKWSILVAWQHGDITIRVPIMLGTAASIFQQQQQSTNDKDHVNSLVATVTPFVLIAIVGVANEILSRFLWQGIGNDEAGGSSSSPGDDGGSKTSAKAKEDAAAQQRLMQRQAESRTAAELEKNGLVIQSAVYEFGDDSSWDVTIPLKFWVNNEKSTLNLSMGSKSNLLGFYPLAASSGMEQDDSMDGTPPLSTATGLMDANKQQETRVPWWKEYWTPTKQRSRPKASSKKKDKSVKPTLKVRYSYEGKDFEKAVTDDEALDLPHDSVDNDTTSN